MPSDEEFDRFAERSEDRDRRQDDRLAEHGAAIKAFAAVQATLVDVVKLHATQDQVDRIEQTQREQIIPDVAVLKDRVMTAPSKQDTGWHDNVERGWGATLQAHPVRVLVGGLVGVLLILAFSVALAVCRSDDPLGTLSRRSVKAQEESAESQDRAADALEALADEVEEIPTETDP